MTSGNVLVAIMNNERDWNIVQEHGWYRIPVSSVRKWLKGRWPPWRLAFYQTKAFGPEGYAIHYHARVTQVRRATRRELLPETPRNDPKADRQYYQLRIGEVEQLAKPIPSLRLRRVVFIPTTWDKFQAALEINDLWDESPLEDTLWDRFKQSGIRAERQYAIKIDANSYFLDFAIFCNEGNIDVEVDGDTFHSQHERVVADKERNNELATKGWRVLRYSSKHIRDRPVDYCVSKVMKTVNQLGGFDNTTGIPPRFDPNDPLGPQQLSLFE